VALAVIIRGTTDLSLWILQCPMNKRLTGSQGRWNGGEMKIIAAGGI
jgi:hypothetical protein